VRATGSDTLVTVLEGKVGLSQVRSKDAFEPEVTLTADQQLNLRAAAPGATVQTVDASAALSWRNRQLVYRGQSLETVVEDLNRYFPLAVALANHALGDLEVSAVIQLTTAETTVQALADALGLEVQRDPQNQHLILYKPE
jgi:transmembrane sensor